MIYTHTIKICRSTPLGRCLKSCHWLFPHSTDSTCFLFGDLLKGVDLTHDDAGRPICCAACNRAVMK